MDPQSVCSVDTWRSHSLSWDTGPRENETKAHQCCNGLNEGNVLIVGSEEEILASRGQEAQQQGSEHDRIQREFWGCSVDICEECGIEAVGD